MRDNTSFLGIINKIDYTFRWSTLSLAPRLKNQYFRKTPFIAGTDRIEEWETLWSGILRLPMLRESGFEFGVEHRRLRELTLDEEEREEAGLLGATGDINETTLALQWTTKTAYLGYQLLVQTGFRLSRTGEEVIQMRDLDVNKVIDSTTGTTTFITVYAGVER